MQKGNPDFGRANLYVNFRGHGNDMWPLPDLYIAAAITRAGPGRAKGDVFGELSLFYSRGKSKGFLFFREGFFSVEFSVDGNRYRCRLNN